MKRFLKVKAFLYGIFAILIVVSLNFLVLFLLDYPLMAINLILKYWFLIVLLIGGFGLQVGLFTYYKAVNALSCSTTTVSGGISSLSMILCCSHYIVNLLPFLGAIIGISTISYITKYAPYFLLFGIFSNFLGIFIIIKQSKSKK